MFTSFNNKKTKACTLSFFLLAVLMYYFMIIMYCFVKDYFYVLMKIMIESVKKKKNRTEKSLG